MNPNSENRWDDPSAASSRGGGSNNISESAGSSQGTAFGGWPGIQNEFNWWKADWFKQWERLARRES